MISLEELNNTFYISADSKSGLCWKVDRFAGNRKVASQGSDCGTLSLNGYWDVKFNYKTYKCHRLILMLITQRILTREEHVDHIDGVKANNNPSNLRLSDATINSRNKKMRKTNRTGVTGVSYSLDARGNPYMTASWQALDKKQKWKRFSVLKYGYDGALRLAKEYRESQIAKLNTDGAGYTDRHGK